MKTLTAIYRLIFPQSGASGDHLVEGCWADQYTDLTVRETIAQQYKNRWNAAPTPVTHPHLFDPLEPPLGWRYDPYYETWVWTKPL